MRRNEHFGDVVGRADEGSPTLRSLSGFAKARPDLPHEPAQTGTRRRRLVAGVGALLAAASLAGAGAAETSSWSARRSDAKAAPVAPENKPVPRAVPSAPPQRTKGVPPRSEPLLQAPAAISTPKAGDDAAYVAFDQGRFLTALRLAEQAAKRGEPQAHTLIGRIHGEGAGVSRNDQLAAQWYARAAELGDIEGAFSLGLMLAQGRGVQKDLVKAGEMFERAARKGHVEANYNLALLFLSGKGKPENPHRAAQHLNYAAEQGIAAAQYDLAALYQNGVGVQADAYQAARWLRKAADQGLVEAQFDYAIVLLKGEGLNADMPRAIELLRAAAERGHAGAQNRLAHALAGGVRMNKDLKEAAKWRLLARNSGIEDTALDALIAKMPQADRIAAEQAAQAWRERYSLGLLQ